MADPDVESAYASFLDDLEFEKTLTGDSAEASFFQLYSRIASENGDCVDLVYSPASSNGKGSYRIDGYCVDTERGILYVAICDFREAAEPQTLNSAHIDSAMQRIRRFIESAVDPSFLYTTKQGDAEFEAGFQICQQASLIRRIRVILFSNARLSTIRPPEPAPEIAGRPVVYNFLDLARYAAILKSRSSPEPIEVDIVALGGKPLPYLPACSQTDEYESYLIALPGELLADIYGLYGARLLEQNVRTFLQAKTKVNKGILATIKDAPEMFFAYNNGLTATASGLTKTMAPDGAPAISLIENLQIVNGGQTTASILYARDRLGSDLSKVFVQMKLSVVKPERVEATVPKISRFANSQNKVSDADFFASHKFHITMQQISRRLSAPPKPGATTGTKWFYERARGQYHDGMAYGTSAERRRFEAEFPRDQVIDKTELAKYETTFAALPHIVCQGAQKCFLQFAEKTAVEWENSELGFNDDWFRASAAKALLFRWTDRMIGGSDWYRNDRGYKSQAVAYTLSWLTASIRRSGKAGLNFQLIWNLQQVPEELQETLEMLAPQVMTAIKKTPDAVRNVGEYCKKQACWNALNQMKFEIGLLPDAIMLDFDESRASSKDARAVRQIDRGIELESLVLSLMPRSNEMLQKAQQLKVLTPASRDALGKLAGGRFPLPTSDIRAIGELLVRLRSEGVEFSPDGNEGARNTIRLSSNTVRTVRI